MAILFNSNDDDTDAWRAALADLLPGMEFRVWPDVGDPADIDYALVWRPKHGDLNRYPNLKCVLSLAAGPEAILGDPNLPRVPIVRLVDTSLTEDVTQYCLHWVLHLHREFHRYREYQRAGRWTRMGRVKAAGRRVGVLGLGELGGRAAGLIAGLGFPTAGWSRTAKELPGIEVFHGPDALAPFLGRTDILVCLLPLTKETGGIIDRHAMARLPRGAYLINAGRGGHVVDDDLIVALDSGHIAGAVLDVFHEEPLPADNPLWRHPKVIVTPHIAGRTHTETAAAVVAENIRRVARGEEPHPAIDRARDY